MAEPTAPCQCGVAGTVCLNHIATASMALLSCHSKLCAAPGITASVMLWFAVAMRSSTGSGPSSSWSPCTMSVGQRTAKRAASSSGRGRPGGESGYPRIAKAAGGSFTARKVHILPPKDRPMRAMGPVRSAERASRHVRRSSSSRAYPLVGRLPWLEKATARQNAPSRSSLWAKACRILWLGPAPYPGARTARVGMLEA